MEIKDLITEFPIPRLVRHKQPTLKLTCQQHFYWCIAIIFSLVEDLTGFLTFGLITWELRAYALFTLIHWMEG